MRRDFRRIRRRCMRLKASLLSYSKRGLTSVPWRSNETGTWARATQPEIVWECCWPWRRQNCETRSSTCRKKKTCRSRYARIWVSWNNSGKTQRGSLDSFLSLLISCWRESAILKKYWPYWKTIRISKMKWKILSKRLKATMRLSFFTFIRSLRSCHSCIKSLSGRSNRAMLRLELPTASKTSTTSLRSWGTCKQNFKTEFSPWSRAAITLPKKTPLN